MKSRKHWKKTAAAFGMTAAVGLCMAQMVLAEEEAGPSTNVWIDVIQRPNQDRISVTVPVAFGFAVIGSQELDDHTPISTADGTLILPNMRVEVDEESGEPGSPDHDYSLAFFGPGEMTVRNYSTTVPEEAEEETGNRTGLAVKLGAFMDAASGETALNSSASGYWTMTGTEPTQGPEDFKKFQMVLDDLPFSKLQAETGGKEQFYMDGEIRLEAPPDVEQSGWTAAGTANVPSEHRIKVDVKIGGVQGHYNQVEESLKVGTIHWTVEADLEDQEGP